MEHLYAKYHGCGHADISKWYITVLIILGNSLLEFTEIVMPRMSVTTLVLPICQLLKMSQLRRPALNS